MAKPEGREAAAAKFGLYPILLPLIRELVVPNLRPVVIIRNFDNINLSTFYGALTEPQLMKEDPVHCWTFYSTLSCILDSDWIVIRNHQPLIAEKETKNISIAAKNGRKD